MMNIRTAVKLSELMAIRNAKELEYLQAEADVLAYLAAKAVVVRDAQPKLEGSEARMQAAHLPPRAKAFIEGLQHLHD